MKNLLLILALSLFVTNIAAQSRQVKIRPASSWIEKISFDKDATPADGQQGSSYYLLLDEQENIAEEESYGHYVYKISNSEGLQQMSDLTFDFDPSFEQLIIHHIQVYRGSEIIDQLPKNIRTLQREKNMDRFLYDESLTAIINLKDIRVGDIVDYGFTRRGYNPVYEKHVDKRIMINYAFPYAKGFIRILIPNNVTANLKYQNTNRKPTVSQKGNLICYDWAFNEMAAFRSDSNEPDWYNGFEYINFSTFQNWNDVAMWAAKHYKTYDHENDEELKEVVAQLPTDKKAYIQKAVRLVQDEIRYLGFESGLNSHHPDASAQVYRQRFGDCKDKSLLLVTLLRARGIEAYPLLVNTYLQHKTVDQLPSINAFNHCVVKITHDNHDIYVDPTIANQGGDIENNYFPPYAKGLVVDSKSEALTNLPLSNDGATHEVQTITLSKIGGEGTIKITTIFKGGDAERQRALFSSSSIADIQRDYLNFYGNLYPNIKKGDQIIFKDDRDNNVFTVEESYVVPNIWKPVTDTESTVKFEFYPLSLETHFSISKSENRTSPYRLTYPLNYTHEIRVQLPEVWQSSKANEDIKSDYYDYHFKFNVEGKSATIKTSYTTKSSYVPLESFSQFVKDHEKMMSNLSYFISYDPTKANQTSVPWQGVMLTILTTLVAAAIMLFLYKNYDPQPENRGTGEPIGGWLMLVGLGVAFTPLRMIFDFIRDISLLTGEGWLNLWSTQQYGFAAFVFLEHIYNIFYVFFSVILLVLFFQKRSSFPSLIIIFYVAGCVITLLDNYVAHQISADAAIDSKEIIRSIITMCIWVPYFRISERAKSTFTNRYEKQGPDQHDLKEKQEYFTLNKY